MARTGVPRHLLGQDHQATGLMADTPVDGTRLAPLTALDQVFTDLADGGALL